MIGLLYNKLKCFLNQRVTYRTVHPDAPPSEWSRKNTGLEKTLRVVVLGCNEKLDKRVDDEEIIQNSDDEDGDDPDGKGTKGMHSYFVIIKLNTFPKVVK